MVGWSGGRLSRTHLWMELSAFQPVYVRLEVLVGPFRGFPGSRRVHGCVPSHGLLLPGAVTLPASTVPESTLPASPGTDRRASDFLKI